MSGSEDTQESDTLFHNTAHVAIKIESKEDEGESEGGSKWTDYSLMLKFGALNALEIEEQTKGEWIQRIRARYIPQPPTLNPPLPPLLLDMGQNTGVHGGKRGIKATTQRLPRRLNWAVSICLASSNTLGIIKAHCVLWLSQTLKEKR